MSMPVSDDDPSGDDPLILRGRAFVFGDQIDTDLLAPGAYMKRPIEELASHCLEAISPEFASQIRPGDFVLGGLGFGMGSSREQAVMALKILGCSAVLAGSVARIFYRNAINLGLPALTFEHQHFAETFDALELDLRNGRVRNLTRNREREVEKLPEFLLDIITAGGLMEHLALQLARKSADKS